MVKLIGAVRRQVANLTVQGSPWCDFVKETKCMPMHGDHNSTINVLMSMLGVRPRA